jgi:hypothetical protein
MSETQPFEVSTWADADVTIGPGNPAHPDHAAWLAEQDEQTDEADEPTDLAVEDGRL